MVDWIFYEEVARDLMRDAYHWDADPKAMTKADITGYAKERGVDAKHLVCAYGNVKYKFDPKGDFE